MKTRDGDFDKVPAWCLEHDDFAWLFPDGSGGCYYTCIVEMGSSECDVHALPPIVEAEIENTRFWVKRN